MMPPETIFVHKACKSQLTKPKKGPIVCEVCNRAASLEEIFEVDNSPSPFAG